MGAHQPTEFTSRYGISVRMLGPNGGGHGARRGHVMHAVRVDDRGFLESLCGYRPSYEWSEIHRDPISCPKCLRRLKRLAAAMPPEGPQTTP